MDKNIVRHMRLVVPMDRFLESRQREIDAAHEMAKQLPEGFVFVSDPDGEVVCDSCNGLIETPTVNLFPTLKCVYCDECAVRVNGGPL